MARSTAVRDITIHRNRLGTVGYWVLRRQFLRQSDEQQQYREWLGAGHKLLTDSATFGTDIRNPVTDKPLSIGTCVTNSFRGGSLHATVDVTPTALALGENLMTHQCATAANLVSPSL